MKVRGERPNPAKSAWHASVLLLASALVAFAGFMPATASAITRPTVLARAHSWVKKRVHYSQHRHYAGYRRDCSGFVSMAWRLHRSYTSSTLHKVARRISLSKLRPGDAVHNPGHVAIFVRWASKKHQRFVAMEETSRGKPARRHVRSLGRRATALRYRHITEARPKRAVKPSAPATPAVPAPPSGITSGTSPATGTVVPASDVSATLTPTLDATATEPVFEGPTALVVLVTFL